MIQNGDRSRFDVEVLKQLQKLLPEKHEVWTDFYPVTTDFRANITTLCKRSFLFKALKIELKLSTKSRQMDVRHPCIVCCLCIIRGSVTFWPYCTNWAFCGLWFSNCLFPFFALFRLKTWSPSKEKKTSWQMLIASTPPSSVCHGNFSCSSDWTANCSCAACVLSLLAVYFLCFVFFFSSQLSVEDRVHVVMWGEFIRVGYAQA